MTASTERRGATLAVLCAMALMIVLDSTVVAVAVPTIQRDLGFSDAGVAWVVNAYLVGFAGLLLLAGRLGDLIGAWRVFLAGVALFTVASLLCGLAPTAELLVAGRFVQGAGGALASAVILGMIVRSFPEPGAQAQAMGVYSFVQAGGATLGLVAGGVVTQTVGWPWGFLVNVPVGVLAWYAAVRLLPRELGLGLRRGLDVPGALLITAGLSLGVYAIVRTAEPAAGTAPTLTLGALAVVLVLGFLARQKQAARPLIPLRLLGRGWLLRTNAAVVLVFAAGLGFQFLTALFLQRVMGYDALWTGLAFLPTPALIGPVSLLAAPRLTARFGPRPVLLGGLVLLAAGLVLFSRAPAAPAYLTDVLPGLLILGLGVGVTIPALIMLSMAGAARSETGMVSGLTNTAQQAGAALGLAVLAAVAAGHTERSGGEPIAALRDGYSLAYLVAAGFVVGALAVTWWLLRRPPADPAASVAAPGAPVAPAAPGAPVAPAAPAPAAPSADCAAPTAVSATLAADSATPAAVEPCPAR